MAVAVEAANKESNGRPDKTVYNKTKKKKVHFQQDQVLSVSDWMFELLVEFCRLISSYLVVQVGGGGRVWYVRI